MLRIGPHRAQLHFELLRMAPRDPRPDVWNRAGREAGVPGKRLHDCRRTAARSRIRAGVPEDVAMMLTGHATRRLPALQHRD